MTSFRIATAFLLLLSDFSASQPGEETGPLPTNNDCQPIEHLGTPGVDRFDYSVSMDVDDDCEYALKITFNHDETLPIPTDPVNQCNPSVVPPEMAPDNLPYFAFRWHYEAFPEDIKAVTKIDHVSIDWNPCGHPPLTAFAAPHYDLHFYRESPEFRTCMTCTTSPRSVDCDPTPGAQTTGSGNAFFDVSTVEEDEAIAPAVIQRVFDPNDQPRNMPPGFTVAMDSMLPHMGGHAWNMDQTPPSPAEWTTPIWVMGPYDGTIVNYEPMIPFAFTSGENDQTFTETLTYEGQTIAELPSSYTVEYDAATGDITITLTGTGADGSCEAKEEEEEPNPVLPYIGDLIERAYPTWCMDESENRLYERETCEDGTPNGRFSPLYFTKQHSGGDPALGGYPTNIDINYAFEFAAPYLGQACAGSPHMCDEMFDGSSTNCKQCPKLKTDHDNGPYGPGHVPPHISLAAVSRAYQEGKGGDITEWFNYDSNACRILPNKLLSLIRLYYQREEDGSVYYPPPFSDAGGAYPLEFVNLAGESCTKEADKHSTAGKLECYEDHSGDISQFPDYLEVGHGSPHYCTKDGKAADINPDYCPYIFFGPNRGKYRHPHIAFSAVEVYLSNLIMPEKCATTWDDSKYPAAVDTTVAFPYMSDIVGDGDDDLVSHPQQPTLNDTGMWMWPGPEGTKRKPVVGNFAINLYAVEGAPMREIPAVVEEEVIVVSASHDEGAHASSEDQVHASSDEHVGHSHDSGSDTIRLSFAVSVSSIVIALLFS